MYNTGTCVNVGFDDGFYVGSDFGFYVVSDDGFMWVLIMVLCRIW